MKNNHLLVGGYFVEWEDSYADWANNIIQGDRAEANT
jgi:hypothetical protein